MPTLGTVTHDSFTPNANTFTIVDHNQNTGSNRYLVLTVTMSNAATFGGVVNGATWNGIAMTQLVQGNFNINQGRHAFFGLSNPATGTNDLVITFGSVVQGSVCTSILSFTGAQSGGNSAINIGEPTPTTPTFTISQDSIVIGLSASNFSTSIIELPQGSSRAFTTCNYYNGTTSIAVSPELSAGTDFYEATTTGGNASLALIEVQNVVATPVITPSPTSLSGFTYVEGSGPSSEQTFTVTGTDLTANITVTAPTNYEVSLSSGSGFGTSVTVTQSGGSANDTVYVRLKSGLSANTYNGENISLTSTGATTKTVTLNGEVTAPPSLTVIPTSLSEFSYQQGSGPSDEQTFTVSGDDLTSNVTVTSSTNYEISQTPGSGFTSSFSLTQSGGNIVGEPVTVYVLSLIHI